INPARTHQLGHLAEKESKQQRANMRSIDVRISHDNDPPVAQFGNIETTFVFAVAILFRFANPSADRRNHGLDLVVLEELIFTRLFDIYQFSADGQNGLITSIASLFGGAACGITFDNVKLR